MNGSESRLTTGFGRTSLAARCKPLFSGNLIWMCSASVGFRPQPGVRHSPYMDSPSFASIPFFGMRYDCSRISGLLLQHRVCDARP